jgi:ArsR family metal-binding transcriptional regulator
MADWYCFRDKVPMEKKDIALSYMDLTQYIPGIKCPVCGEEYLTEDIVTTVVQAAEDALEAK